MIYTMDNNNILYLIEMSAAVSTGNGVLVVHTGANAIMLARLEEDRKRMAAENDYLNKNL